MRRTLVNLLFSMTALAQVRDGKFQNRDAWILDSPKLRVTVMQSGGHIAELVLKGPDEINPLWIQKQPTMDADRFDAAKDSARYGAGPSARLMSGLLGHNVCFPFWGNPSEAEAKAGMTFHGETGITRWKRNDAAAGTLAAGAVLPQSMTRFNRKMQVKGQVLAVESVAENLSAWDRPVGWCEHVTLGAPFLEKGVTLIDSALGRGRSGAETVFYEDAMRSVPDAKQAYGFVKNFSVAAGKQYGYFTAVHPGKRLLVGYLFPRSEFRWLNVWEANNSGTLTRGMEFSNTPTHGTMQAMVAAPTLFGEPTYEWLEAKSKLTKHFYAFLSQVPAGFQGVADVRLESKKLVIKERNSQRTVELEWGF